MVSIAGSGLRPFACPFAVVAVVVVPALDAVVVVVAGFAGGGFCVFFWTFGFPFLGDELAQPICVMWELCERRGVRRGVLCEVCVKGGGGREEGGSVFINLRISQKTLVPLPRRGGTKKSVNLTSPFSCLMH